MSKCERYQEMLSAYTDGALSKQETAVLSEHLAQCPSCRALLDVYRAISNEAGSLLVDPPDEMTQNIMDKIQCADMQADQPEMIYAAKKRTHSIWLRVIASAACIVLIIFAVRYINNSSTSTQDSATPETAMYDEEYDGSTAANDSNSDTSNMSADQTPESTKRAQTSDGTDSSSTDSALVENTDAASEPSNFNAAEESDTSIGEDTDTGTADATYYAVVTIHGQLPDELSEYTFTDCGDGTRTAVIPAEIVAALTDSGYSVETQDTDASDALVIFYPQD